MKILVTGSAGFIGFHLCRRALAARGISWPASMPWCPITIRALKEKRASPC